MRDEERQVPPGGEPDEPDRDLARAWIALQYLDQESENPNEYGAFFWAFEELDDLTRNLPQEAWRVILMIWSMDQSDKIAENLSAGPVEDLLAKHGPSIIDIIEAEAWRDPTFARLLGGVWKNTMTNEVWERIQRVRDRRGWDGNPGVVN